MGIIIPPDEIDRKYRNVDALSSLNFDHIVPNGKTLTITELGANSVQKPTTKVCIIWNPGGAQEEILLATVGDIVQSTKRQFVGDGVRAMRINLDNQDTVQQTMGAYYLGSES